jgi:GR25 family glycosyltransferase involved in LPS biosynthesis
MNLPQNSHSCGQPIVDGIHEAWVINLDKRPDRLESFLANHPRIRDRVQRLSAVDGRALTLTHQIARLFKPNNYKWRKSVMGCALSQLSLWHQLAQEKSDQAAYLILEDDARLQPEWMARWHQAYLTGSLPSDWEIIFLGGVLPQNRNAFRMCSEPLNEHLGRIKENKAFGQHIPNRYFHFCAYAYVLSARGARKVLKKIHDRGGIWAGADIVLTGVLDVLFLNPLVASCFQDQDQAYLKQDFANFSETHSYDSDICNNLECFPEEEANALIDPTLPISFSAALLDAKSTKI